MNFYREKDSALSSTIDSRRSCLDPSYNRRSRQLVSFQNKKLRTEIRIHDISASDILSTRLSTTPERSVWTVNRLMPCGWIFRVEPAASTIIATTSLYIYSYITYVFMIKCVYMGCMLICTWCQVPTGWVKNDARNLWSIQCPRRFLEIDPEIWYTCSLSPCQAVVEWFTLYFYRQIL